MDALCCKAKGNLYSGLCSQVQVLCALAYHTLQTLGPLLAWNFPQKATALAQGHAGSWEEPPRSIGEASGKQYVRDLSAESHSSWALSRAETEMISVGFHRTT